MARDEPEMRRASGVHLRVGGQRRADHRQPAAQALERELREESRASTEHLQARDRHRTGEDAELERYQRSAAGRPRSGRLRIPVSRTSGRECDSPSAVLETVFSCQHCTRSLCTHAVLRVQSRHTLYRAPAPSCWCIQHVGSPRPQPAGSKPSARSGGRLTRMMADASEQEARACELLSSSLTATADARRAHRFLSSGALPFSLCVPRCHVPFVRLSGSERACEPHPSELRLINQYFII